MSTIEEKWSNIDSFYTELYQRVLEEDLDAQRYYLSMIEDQRKIPVDWLIEQGILFIPNNDYITYHMGSDALNPKYGVYLNGICLWNLFVLIPIRDLANRVVGFVGWDAENKRKSLEGEQGLNMYKVSSKYVFQKENYFLGIPNILKECYLRSKTIFVVDGVFDSMALNRYNIPTIALLGSSVSPVIGYFLRWFERVFVIKDNDDAGNKLLMRINSKAPVAKAVMQSKTKDIEELLRNEDYAMKVISRLNDAMEPHALYTDINLDRIL